MTPGSRRWAVIALCGLGWLIVPAPSATAAGGRTFTDVPQSSTQVISVTASSWNASYARLRVWQRDERGQWTRVLSAPARIGANGLVPADRRKQNTSTTPAGTFALGPAFGVGTAPPDTEVPYRQVTSRDYWVYDPADPQTYNRWVVGHRKSDKWSTDEAEHLIEYSTEYRYALVIDNNHAVAQGKPDTTAGGGIFLHVDGGRATAGCVSIPRAKMARVLRWLDPAGDPRIVVGVKP